jgi:hypothetical protein
MPWWIHCTDTVCGRKTWASNILDLLAHHRDPATGFFGCTCGRPGCIPKRYNLQEPGGVWKPFLRGAITLGREGDIYQPFVFLVSDSPTAPITDVWFSYYKDTRSTGGRLKLGHGPGGPPVLGVRDVEGLVTRFRELGFIG